MGIWLVVSHIFYLSTYWECHHPNWRTPSFFRGVGRPPTSMEYLSTKDGGRLAASGRSHRASSSHPKMAKIASRSLYNNFLQWHDIWPWWWSWLDDLLKLPVSQLVLVDSGHPVVGESHLNLLLVLVVLLNSSKLQNCGSAKLCPVPFWVVRVTGTVTRVSKSQGLMKSIGPLISPQIAAPWFNQHLMTHLGHQRIFLGIHDSLGFIYPGPGLRIPIGC